jgi:hypothetical protein
MPRLLSRTLFVLGGAIAATATAWLISSATASAATVPLPGSGAPVSGALSDSVAGLAHPDALAAPAVRVTTSPGALTTHHAVALPGSSALPGPSALPTVVAPHAPPALAGVPILTLPANHDPAAGVGSVTGELRTAVSQIGAHVPVSHGVAVTPLPVWPPVPVSASAPAGRSGPAGVQAVSWSPPTATAVATRPVEAGPATAVRSVVEHPVHRQAHRVRSAVPASPAAPAQTPWSPVTVPAAPGGGGPGGTPGAGGVGLVEQPGAPQVPGLDAIRVVPVTSPLGRATSGKQPGITPD